MPGNLILAVNAKLSTLKMSLFHLVPNSMDYPVPGRPTRALIARASITKLNTPQPILNYQRGLEEGLDVPVQVRSLVDGFKYILPALLGDERSGAPARREHVTHVCHRVMHGGKYAAPKMIDEEVEHYLESLMELTPQQDGVALCLIDVATMELPNAINIACFDTVFHRTIPAHISIYPIDQNVALHYGLKRYGFHGLSYSCVLRRVASHLEQDEEQTNLIAVYLGNNMASACAIKFGRSWDTSTGLTPLEGLPGAISSGSIDPSVLFHPGLKDDDPLRLTQQGNQFLNTQCGWKGLTGIDDFLAICDSDDPMCQLTFDTFVDRVVAYVGSYFVKLDGRVDALVFSGGVGEKSARLRSRITESCQSLGFRLDTHRNETCKTSIGMVLDIGHEESMRKVLVCHSDEEYEMAFAVARHEEHLAAARRQSAVPPPVIREEFVP